MDKKLVAYVTAGLYGSDFTTDLALKLAQSGTDIIELGVPFSDPVADGEVIQRASHLALQQGVQFADVLDITSAISLKVDTLLMGYFNPFYQYGVPALLSKLSSIGSSGLIIPDLPHEESRRYGEIFEQHNLANITFVAPTDTDRRIETIVRDAKKFIYLVAYAGITGSAKSERLDQSIESIRRHSNTPIYVGFGVNEKSAKSKAEGVDGVIVGSAFVSVLLRDDLSLSAKIDKCAQISQNIKEKINS